VGGEVTAKPVAKRPSRVYDFAAQEDREQVFFGPEPAKD
jgi:hypothetical protein